MRLAAFQIKNFKSIVDTGFCELPEKDNITILAGQNEAGKSAIIESLDFFRNGPQPDFERLLRRQGQDPEVTCTFLLEDWDIENIFNETENQKLRSFLTKNPKITFVRRNVGDIEFESKDSEQLASFFVVDDNPAPETEGQEVANKASITTLEGLLKDLVIEMRKFVFYDSFRDLLPGEVPVADISNHQAVMDFQAVFKANFSDIAGKDARAVNREESRLEKEASDDLNTYWSQQLEENGRYNFKVKILPHETSPKIQFLIDRNDGDPLYMEQKSQGFQWFSAFNLRLRALGVEESSIKNLVILIDEPGQGLHERAQKDVKKVLNEIASKGAQIIYTTHNPNLIGVVGKEFARIRLVTNEKDFCTKVETVAQFSGRKHKGGMDALSPIVTAMGLSASHSLLDPNLRLNVLVEGISDHYYLSAFQKLLDKDDKLCFIPACGVNNIANVASVLLGWGYPFKAVFDDDRDSGRKAYNQLKKEFFEDNDTVAGESIKKIKDCMGIEDIFDPKDFYKFILKESYPTKVSKSNSELVKGKKELVSRVFLEDVETDSSKITLSKSTRTKVEEIFSWLYSKFDLKD
ncbi:MAG: ATP-binding protein [bacterium]|nr:ATP-binding protein [bacterium]